MLRALPRLFLLAACTAHSTFGQVTAVSSSRDSAARARDVRDLLAAEHEWVRVTVKGDADAFASFLADGYVALSSSGRLMDKASWTARIRAGTTHYDSVALRDLRVRFPTPDIAIVTGEFSQAGVAEGTDNSHSGVYINTWIRTRVGWRVVSSGFTKPPLPAP